MFNKEEFYTEQKKQICQEYDSMRKAKIKRDDCLFALEFLFDYSKSTIEQILYNPKYRNLAKDDKTKIMPQSA